MAYILCLFPLYLSLHTPFDIDKVLYQPHAGMVHSHVFLFHKDLGNPIQNPLDLKEDFNNHLHVLDL